MGVSVTARLKRGWSVKQRFVVVHTYVGYRVVHFNQYIHLDSLKFLITLRLYRSIVIERTTSIVCII